jgi:large subunit ribosomal protein L23
VAQRAARDWPAPEITSPLPKKDVSRRLKSALAKKFKENQLNVVDAFTLDSHKTKAFSQRLRSSVRPQDLLVDHQENPNLWLAARNSERCSAASESAGHALPRFERESCRVHEGGDSSIAGGADQMTAVYRVIKRPVITEKGLTLKENERTLCFEVDQNASKTEIQEAVEQLFKVKVQHVRTMVVPGKMRRRGKYSGYRSDWKKAYVTLREGEKMIEYGENL